MLYVEKYFWSRDFFYGNIDWIGSPVVYLYKNSKKTKKDTKIAKILTNVSEL